MARIKSGSYQSINSNEIDPVTGLTNTSKNVKESIIASSSPDLYMVPDEWGKSKYDSNILPSQLFNLGEVRAQRQSSADKWFNASLKFGITAATTFGDMLGTVVGVAEMAEDGKLSSFVDNSWTRAMLSIQEWSEKELPNYYTKEELDTPWYQNLGTANFWADKVLKNFGFAVGAFASAAVTGGIGASALGLNAARRGLVNNVGKGLFSKVVAGKIDDVASKQIITALKTRGLSASDDIVKSIIQDGKRIKNLSLANQITASVVGSMAESRFEAGHAMKEFTENQKVILDTKLASGEINQEQYNLELQDVEEKAKSLGNRVFGLNLAVLSAGNFMQWSKALSRGYDTQKDLMRGIKGSIKNQYKTTKPITKLGKIRDKALAATIGIKNALIEGNEEMMQRTISEGTKWFYEKEMSGESDTYINSLIDGFKDTYGNIANWEEFVIGAFSGGMGIPTIQNGKFAMAGGIYGDIKAQANKDAKAQEVLTRLNKLVNSDDFKRSYYAANFQSATEADKVEALVKDNKFEFLNAEDLEITNLVNTFYTAGKLEDLIDWADGLKNLKADEIRGFLDVNKEVDENGNVKESTEITNPLLNKTDQEIEAYNSKRAEAIKTKIEVIRDIREGIDSKFGDSVTIEGRQALSNLLSATPLIEIRMNELEQIINDNLYTTDGRTIKEIANKSNNLFRRYGKVVDLSYKRRAAKGLKTKAENVLKSINDLESEASKIQEEIDFYRDSTSKEAIDKKETTLEEVKTKLNSLKDKKTSIEEKKKNYQKRYDKFNNQYLAKKNELDKALEEEYNQRKKVSEQYEVIYKDLTLQEYSEEVNQLIDQIEDYETAIKESYNKIGENPLNQDRIEKAQEAIKDMTKLASMRNFAIESYLSAIQSVQKDPNHFRKLREEVREDLRKRDSQARIDRIKKSAKNFTDGILLVDKDGNEVKIKDTNGTVRVLGKNKNGKFTVNLKLEVNQEFIETYKLPSEINKEAAEEPFTGFEGFDTKTTTNASGIYISKNKAGVTGTLFIYKTTQKKQDGTEIQAEEQYLATPNGTFYRIYGDNGEQALGTRKYTSMYFNKGTLLNSNKQVSIEFEGTVEVDKTTGTRYIVKYQSNPVLDNLIRSEEEFEEVKEEDLNNLNDLEIVEDPSREDTSIISTNKEGNHEIDLERFATGNSGKVLLQKVVFTKNPNKKGKKWIETREDISDTETGREALENVISLYEAQTGRSLFQDLYNNKKVPFNERESTFVMFGKDKVYYDLPKNVAKSIVLIPVKKGKGKKSGWGRPITITDPNIIKGFSIYKNDNGNYYTFYNGKYHLIKEQDYQGQYKMFDHWRYKYTILNKEGDTYTFKDFEENSFTIPTELIDAAIESGELVENVDYIKTKNGIKLFRNLSYDEDLKQFEIKGHTSPSKIKNEDTGYWNIKINKVFKDVSSDLSNLEKHDSKYTAIYNGNKIGIKRQGWKYPIIEGDGQFTLGKSSELSYKDKENFKVNSGEIGTVTEPSETDKVWDPIPRIVLDKYSRNVLFATTFTEVSADMDNPKNIDNAPDNVKRYNFYLSNNNVTDGSHGIILVRGADVGWDYKEKDLIVAVIGKKDGTRINPVDSNGNIIELSEVFEKGIVTTIPDPSRYTTDISSNQNFKGESWTIIDNNKKSADKEITVASRFTTKEVVEAEINNYKTFYEQTLKELQDKPEGIVTKIIRTTEGKNLHKNSDSPVMLPTEQALQELLSNPDNYEMLVGTTVNSARFKVNLRNGYVYIKDSRNSNIYELQTNLLTDNQKQAVVEILKLFASNAKVELDGKVRFSSTAEVGGTPIDIIREGLQRIVYFQDRNNTKLEGVKRLKELNKRLSEIRELTREDYKNILLGIDTESLKKATGVELEAIKEEIKKIKEGSLPGYRINNNPKTQFYLADAPDNVNLPGGLIVIGENIFPFLDQDALEDGNSQINPEVLPILEEFLSNRRLNVNSSLLIKGGSFDSVEFEDGKLEQVTYRSYKKYVAEHTTTSSIEHKLDSENADSIITNVNRKIIFQTTITEPEADPDDFGGEDTGGMERGTLTKENLAKGKAKIKSKYSGVDDALGRKKESTHLDESSEERLKRIEEIRKKREAKKVTKESTNTEDTTDTPLENTSDDDPLSGYMLRKKALMSSKELEDFDKFSKWVVENLGYAFYRDFVSIDNTIIMEGKFGEFSNNIIKLYADAELGTGYHETFHAVRALLLSNKEYERVVRQFTSDPRFKNRISEMEELYKGKSREDIIEEALAEEFREFVLTNGESLKQANAPVVKGFFKKLWNWIQTLLNRNDAVHELFSKINSGKYKNRTPRTTSSTKSRERTKFGMKEFDKIEVHEDIMQGFTSLFFNRLFTPSFVEDGLYELFGKESNNELVGKIYSNIENTLKAQVEVLKARNNPANDYYIKVQEHILNNFGPYVGDHMSYLSKYNIEEIEEVNENDMVGRSESGNQYNYSSLKVSAKANSTGIIKALLGSLVSLDSKTKKMQVSNVGLPKHEPFGKVFSILINKLSNTTTIEEKFPILTAISEKVPELKDLMKRLKIESYMDPKAVLSLNFRDMEILSKFNQTFSKNTNNFILSLIGADGAYNSIDSNEQSFIFNVKNSWKSNFNTHPEYNKRIEKTGSIIFYNPSYYKNEKYRKVLSKDAAPEDYVNFLNAVGIYVTEDVLTKDTYKGFTTELYKNILRGNQPVIYSNSNTTDFSGRLDQFIKGVTENAIDYIENSHRNFNGDLVYNNTVNSPISLVFNKLNQIRSENSGDISKIVAEEFPFLDMSTNPYIKNSAILRDLFINPEARISLNINEGIRLEGDQKGLSFKDFSYSERLFTWFKEYKKGNYVLMRPADNSIERFITLNNVSLLKIEKNNKLKSDPISSLLLYLEDELALASDRNNLKYLNFAKNRFSGIAIDMIKEEAKLQNQEQIYEDLKTAIKSGTYIEFLNEYESELREFLESYIERKSKEASDTFKKYKINHKMLGVESGSFDSEIKNFVLHHIASSIEQTKLITGSIIFSKDLGNMYKRNSGVANTKKVSWVGKKEGSLENWIKNNLKRIDREDHYNDEFWFKEHPVLNTMILNDVISGSNYSKEYKEILGDRAESYNDAEAGDGYSIAHIDEFRELLFRSGDWNEDLENLRTYEIKGYLKYLVESNTDADWAKKQYKRLFEQSYDSWDGKLVKNSKAVINSLKPQYRGPLAVDGFVPSMYKTSLGPLLPSMFIDFKTMKVTRPNMLSLYKQMTNKGVGIVSFYSANKGMSTIINKEIPENTADEDVNSELMQDTYNDDGSVNDFESYIIQPTYYSFWGIQLDTGFKEKNKVVYGTQMLKQLLNGVFDFGNINPESPIAKKYEKYIELNNKRLSLGINMLQKKLGLYLDDNGKWTYDDNVEVLIDSLRKEAISRDMPENLIEQIDYLIPVEGQSSIPLDALVNSSKMKNILFSMADALTISQKAFGKASYQIPSLFFESDNKKIRRVVDGKGKERIVSDELNFYGFNRDEEGNITGVKSMEVYLPSYMKGIVDIGKVDSKLLQLVGFRIPTQGLNSIESIVVKGFLSDSLGDVIVLPTEIVTKAGSDYDIDKLNIYIPNFYKNSEGKFVYLDNSITYEAYIKDKNENYIELSEEEFNKKIIENELLVAMNDIITDKDNARQLLNPLDSDNFDKLIKEIEKINPLIDKTFIRNFSNYADPLFHSQISMQNMEGAGAIGIAANSAIFQIYSSLNNFKIARTFVHTLTKGDIDENSGKFAKEKENISTKINLPHNKDEDGKVALGGLKDANNDMFLYDIFNAYITLTVDNAKNNTLSYLNAGLKTLNTALYLAMAGVPYRHIHFFLRQPIIMKYMENMNIYESFFLKAEGNDKFTDEIADITFKEFLGKSSEEFVKNNGESNIEFTEDRLKEMLISEPRKDNLKEQHQILSDFLRYQKTATRLNKAIQATQYDTKSLGRNATDSMVLKTATDFMQESGFIENFDNAFNNDKSFISKYKEALETVNNMLSPFSLVMNDSTVNTYFRAFIYKYFKDDPGFGLERIKDIIHTWESSLLSYIVLSKPFSKNRALADYSDHAFKGENSVPKMINDIKNIIEKGNRNNGVVDSKNQSLYDAFRNNSIIQYLTPVIDPSNPIDGLTLAYKGKDATESDKLTEHWRELLNGDVLYEGVNVGQALAVFTLLQSGTQFSPISFTDIMPHELYISIISGALSSTITVEDMKEFTVSFFIHNETSPDIVKYTTDKKIGKAQFNEKPLKVLANLFPLVKTKVRLDQYKNKSEEDIIDLIRKGKRVDKLKRDLYFSKTVKKLPDFGNMNNYKEGLSLLKYGSKELKKFSEQFGYLFFPDYSNLSEKPVKKGEFIELKDGNYYSISDINTEMLENMGYKPKEIGNILKKYVC